MSVVAERRRQRFEVAEIFRLYGEDYVRSHRLSSTQLKAIKDISKCRTSELGGHLEKCNQCGFERPCYNSCRNRHCPKCQCLTKARWLEARKSELLPVSYFHAVFTLPHELNPLALYNKKVVYDLLFSSVSKTLQKFGEQTLGGKMAATMILHTWDQQLRDHLHVHCAIPSFALRATEGELSSVPELVRARENFLFPVKAMGIMFRGKFLAGLKSAYGRQKISWPKEEFHGLVNSLYKKSWIVYNKPSFQGPTSVLDYIGRYTHRIAISNERILNVASNQVTFSYRDRSDGNQKKEMTLAAEEFMRRFLLHTLPPSFMKIRHVGFLANKVKKKELGRCREILGVEKPLNPKRTTRELLKELTGFDLEACPQCREGTMITVAEISREANTS